MLSHRLAVTLVALATCCGAGGAAQAQSLEPSATAPATAAAWSPQRQAHRFSAGFDLQSQVVSPSVAAALASRQAPFASNAPSATVLVVGASMRTGERSSLSLQTPIALRAPGPEAAPQRADGQEMQLAWSLRSRDAAAQWRSPLRMAFSGGQTVVTLKPRKSRVSITVQHQW